MARVLFLQEDFHNDNFQKIRRYKKGDIYRIVNDNDHVAEFLKNQTTSEFIVTGQPVEGEMPAAGYYTGTVEFVVELGVKPPQY